MGVDIKTYGQVEMLRHDIVEELSKSLPADVRGLGFGSWFKISSSFKPDSESDIDLCCFVPDKAIETMSVAYRIECIKRVQAKWQLWCKSSTLTRKSSKGVSVFLCMARDLLLKTTKNPGEDSFWDDPLYCLEQKQFVRRGEFDDCLDSSRRRVLLDCARKVCKKRAEYISGTLENIHFDNVTSDSGLKEFLKAWAEFDGLTERQHGGWDSFTNYANNSGNEKLKGLVLRCTEGSATVLQRALLFLRGKAARYRISAEEHLYLWEVLVQRVYEEINKTGFDWPPKFFRPVSEMNTGQASVAAISPKSPSSASLIAVGESGGEERTQKTAEGVDSGRAKEHAHQLTGVEEFVHGRLHRLSEDCCKALWRTLRSEEAENWRDRQALVKRISEASDAIGVCYAIIEVVRQEESLSPGDKAELLRLFDELLPLRLDERLKRAVGDAVRAGETVIGSVGSYSVGEVLVASLANRPLVFAKGSGRGRSAIILNRCGETGGSASELGEDAMDRAYLRFILESWMVCVDFGLASISQEHRNSGVVKEVSARGGKANFQELIDQIAGKWAFEKTYKKLLPYCILVSDTALTEDELRSLKRIRLALLVKGCDLWFLQYSTASDQIEVLIETLVNNRISVR